MRRQLLATTAAIITTLALAATVPAFAQEQEGPTEFEGNPVLCEDLVVDDLELVFLDGVDFTEEPELPTVITQEEFDELFDPELPIVAVIVQGDESANVYFEPPDNGLVAPENGEISFIDVCGVKEGSTPTPNETPTDEPTKPVETPAPVPTEVPAGTNAGAGGSVGLWGMIAASSAAVAGAAMFARRRFLNDS